MRWMDWLSGFAVVAQQDEKIKELEDTIRSQQSRLESQAKELWRLRGVAQNYVDFMEEIGALGSARSAADVDIATSLFNELCAALSPPPEEGVSH
jgi:hypothetical protein